MKNLKPAGSTSRFFWFIKHRTAYPSLVLGVYEFKIEGTI